MRAVALICLALFVGAFYLPPIPTAWTHRQLASCYYERTWLGKRLNTSEKPWDFDTRARACFAGRGGYKIGATPAGFVVVDGWKER